MMQRDVTTKDLTQTDEAAHRDSFYFSLLRNHFLVPRAEFKVIKVIHYSLELQAHFVIVVGSRHILLWDMDEEGNLAAEPRLVQVPSRSKQTG